MNYEFLLEDFVLTLGIVLTVGYLGALFLKRFGIPNVIAYLLTGVVLDKFFFNGAIASHEAVYKVIESLALGLIGYKIGTEIELDMIKEKVGTLLILLFAEAGGKFLVVFVIIQIFFHNFILAVVLGALATATAPAATIEIIRKFRAKGEVTTWIQWILAFDDIVAVVFVEGLIIYITLMTDAQATISIFLVNIFHEIFIAIGIGIITGLLLSYALEKMDDTLEILEIMIGFIALTIGISEFIGTSVITSTVVLGAVDVNTGSKRFHEAIPLLESIMSPILMIFFMMIGARSSFTMNPFPIIAFLYLLARSTGVISGAYIGGRIARLQEPIRSSIGFGLLAQGGVALALIAVVNDVFIKVGKPDLGKLVITAVVISTLFTEMLGAIGTKYALTRSGEIQKIKDVTLVDPLKH